MLVVGVIVRIADVLNFVSTVGVVLNVASIASV